MPSFKSAKQARGSARAGFNKAGNETPSTTPAVARIQRSYRRLLWLGFALPLGLYILVVLLAPVDVLDKLPWLRTVADSTQSYIVSKWAWIDIYRHAKSTQFPQMAMLASVLRIFVVLFMALSMYIHIAMHFKAMRERQVPMTLKNILVGLIVLPLIIFFVMWDLLCEPVGTGRKGRFIGQSELFYAWITSIVTLFTGMALAYWPGLMLHFLIGIFENKKDA